MSQEKVDRYKEYKANRKENLEKERKAKKRNAMIWKGVGIFCAVALVVALGVTAYNMIKTRIQARPDYDRSEMIIRDVAGILEEETTEAPSTVPEGESTEAPADETPAESGSVPESDIEASIAESSRLAESIAESLKESSRAAEEAGASSEQ